MATNEPRKSVLTVEFDEQERAEVYQLLDEALRDTRVEVHRTHTPDYREKVKQREEILKRLIERFRNPGS